MNLKKILFIISYSLYIAFLLGLILHTSAHPQILGKYTSRYFILLIILLIGFIPFLFFEYFLTLNTKLKFKKNKFTITPKLKLISVFILLLVVFFSAELYLRNKYQNYESDSYTYTLDNFNPFLQSQLGQQETDLPVNSLGFRGEDISAVKPKGTYRIVVLGGSTVLDREVPFEESAVRVLEKKLKNYYPNKKIEVINAGKDYYTSEHSLIQYMFKIADLNPDLVIMYAGANDEGISCSLEGVVSHGPYQPDYSNYYGAVASIIFNHFRPQPFIQFKSVAMDFLIKAMEDNLYSDITGKINQAAQFKAAQDYIAGKNTVKVRDFPSLDSYKRNLQYLIDLTREKQTKLILGDQPNLLKSNNSVEEVEKIMYPTVTCRKDGKYYDLGSLKYGLDIFNQATKQVAQENNVMFVNLDNSIPKNLSYFLDSLHYTEKGNQLVADTLFNYLVANNVIK